MAFIDNQKLMDSVLTTMPKLSEIQTEKVKRFFEGEGMELLNDSPLYKSVLETTVGFYLELIREWRFKNPLEDLGVIRRGANLGFNIQRMYVYESDNTFNEPSFLEGPVNSAGAPLVPTKKNWNIKQKFTPYNLAAQIWTTIWDDMYFSNVANDEGDRALLISMIVNDVYKKWEKYIYALESTIISDSGDSSKLKDTQQIAVNLGGDTPLAVNGDGAVSFVNAYDNLIQYGKTVGTANFNEESFQDYFDDDDLVLMCRLGFKNALRAAIMKQNFYSPEYVEKIYEKLIEVPCPLSPCKWSLKADDSVTSGEAGQELHVVYSDDGNGIPLGLSINDDQKGQASVQYSFDSDKVKYAELNENIFAVLIDKNRINIISGPGGELNAEMTVRDAFRKCSDLVLSTFGVNASNGAKVGASVFIDRTYPYVVFVNDKQD